MEVVGVVSGVVAIISSVTKLAKNLNEVRDKYKNVALSTTLVASQLSTIRAALEAIADWRRAADSSSQYAKKLDEDLALSLNCCAILVTVIDSKLGESGYLPGMKARIDHLWLEGVLKEYLSNLDGQVRSLQLLLTIFQCRTATEQSQRLERTESRTILENLRAETASLQPDSRELWDAASMRSADPSVNLEVDSILLKSPPYRKAYGNLKIHRRELSSEAAEDKPKPAAPVISKDRLVTEKEDEFDSRHYQHRLPQLDDIGLSSRVMSGTISESRVRQPLSAKEVRVIAESTEIKSTKSSPNGKERDENTSLIPSPSKEVVHNQIDEWPRDQHNRKAQAPWLELAITDSGLDLAYFESDDSHILPVSGESMTERSQNESSLGGNQKTGGLCDDLDSNTSSVHNKDKVENLVITDRAINRSPRREPRPLSVATDLYDASIESSLAEGQGRMSLNPQEDPFKDPISQSLHACQSMTSLTVHTPIEGSKCSRNDEFQRGSPKAWESYPSQRPLSSSMKVPSFLSAETDDQFPKDATATRRLYSSGSSVGSPILRGNEGLASPTRRAPSPPDLIQNTGNPSNSTPKIVTAGRQAVSSATSSSVDSSQISSSSPDCRSSMASIYPPESIAQSFLTSPTVTSRASSISEVDPSLARNKAQAELLRLQRDLAEAKAKGDKKSAKDSLQKSIKAIRETYLSADTPSGAAKTSIPSKPKPRHNTILRMPSRPSFTQISSRLKKSQATAAIQAVQSGDRAKLKELLGEGMSVNARFKNLTTLLMEVALQGNINCMELLKERGADEVAVDENGRNVLHLTVVAQQSRSVQWLLKAYASTEDQVSRQKLWKANRVPTVSSHRSHKSLLEASDIGGSKPLHIAAQQGSIDMVNLLLDHGADIEAKDNWGGTPLHLAVITNCIEIVQVLLSKGAVAGSADVKGETPLHRAARLDNVDIIQILLSAGAERSVYDNNGYLPIHSAAREGCLAAVEALTPERTDLNSKTFSGDSLLHIAVLANRLQVVEHLLQNKADPNPWSSSPPAKLDASGNTVFAKTNRRAQAPSTTPLHCACFAANYEMAALLLDHAALVNAATADGKPPLMLAVESDDTNLVYLLLARGAKVDVKIPNSLITLSHLATEKGNLDTMQVLYQYGASIDARTSDGKAPAEYVLRCKNAAKKQALIGWYQDIRVKNTAQAREIRARNRQRDEQRATQQVPTYYTQQSYQPVSNPDQMALIRQLSPNYSSFDPEYDSFPEAPPPYVAGPSAPGRLARRDPVYRPQQ